MISLGTLPHEPNEISKPHDLIIGTIRKGQVLHRDNYTALSTIIENVNNRYRLELTIGMSYDVWSLDLVI
jgi:hypothetical protein